jgi:hypothetical protein
LQNYVNRPIHDKRLKSRIAVITNGALVRFGHANRRLTVMTTQSASAKADPLAGLGDAIESAAGALGDAGADARQAAKVAARKVKTAAHTGAYRAAYGASFGVVFGAVFLVELLPENNVFRRGLEDGAEAGFDAAIAKSAARRAGNRSTGAGEEDLNFDEDEAPKPAARKDDVGA